MLIFHLWHTNKRSHRRLLKAGLPKPDQEPTSACKAAEALKPQSPFHTSAEAADKCFKALQGFCLQGVAVAAYGLLIRSLHVRYPMCQVCAGSTRAREGSWSPGICSNGDCRTLNGVAPLEKRQGASACRLYHS